MKRLGIALVTALVLILALGVASAKPPEDGVSPVETLYAGILGYEVGIPDDVVYEDAPRLPVLKKDGTQAMGDIYFRTVDLMRRTTIPVTELVDNKEILRIAAPDAIVIEVITLNYYIAEFIDGEGNTIFLPVYLHGAPLESGRIDVWGVEM